MKILFLFLVFIPVLLFSQSPYQHWQWAKSFGGDGLDSTVDIKIKNGYLYVTGIFSSPQINWESTLLTNQGGNDIFVAKLDTNGNTIWIKQFGGTGDDIVSQIEVNNSGSCILRCSSSGSSITIGSTTLTSPASFYAKLDTDGNLVNAVVMPTPAYSTDIDIDYTGAVYAAVKYGMPFSFASTPVDTSIKAIGAAILKYNNAGEAEWVKFISLTDPETGITPSASVLIESSDFDTSVNAIWAYNGYYTAAVTGFDPINFKYYGNLYTKLSFTGIGLNIKNYTGGSLGLVFRDFETGSSGLDYSSTEQPLLNFPYVNHKIIKWYNTDREKSLNFVEVDSIFGQPTGDIQNPFKHGTFRVNESGNLLLINQIDYNNVIEVLDSNLNRIKKIEISDRDNRYWSIKCMSDTNAVYFTNSYAVNQLILNEQIYLTTPFTLNNNGASDIFIGKYKSVGMRSIYTTIGNGNWSNPGIWSDNSLPTMYSNVLILHDIVVDMDVTVNSLKVIAPATLTVTSGHTLTVLH